MRNANKVQPSFASFGVFGGLEMPLTERFSLDFEPHIRVSPNRFDLNLFDSKAITAFESGLTMRLRFK